MPAPVGRVSVAKVGGLIVTALVLLSLVTWQALLWLGSRRDAPLPVGPFHEAQREAERLQDDFSCEDVRADPSTGRTTAAYDFRRSLDREAWAPAWRFVPSDEGLLLRSEGGASSVATLVPRVRGSFAVRLTLQIDGPAGARLTVLLRSERIGAGLVGSSITWDATRASGTCRLQAEESPGSRCEGPDSARTVSRATRLIVLEGKPAPPVPVRKAVTLDFSWPGAGVPALVVDGQSVSWSGEATAAADVWRDFAGDQVLVVRVQGARALLIRSLRVESQPR